MTPGDRAIYHQIHPLKLATDIASAAAGLLLLAERRLMPAVTVLLLPPALVSAYLMTCGRLEHLPLTRRGRQMRRMTPTAMLLRLVGMLAMCVGAWRHDWTLLTIGAVGILSVWLRVLL